MITVEKIEDLSCITDQFQLDRIDGRCIGCQYIMEKNSMPSRKRTELYDIFTGGSKPTQDDFTDLIDSALNVEDDGIGASENGEPMEIIAKGKNDRFLDLSIQKETPAWRISGLSGESKVGLNISSNNGKGLFIEKDSGFTGIGNGTPKAKVHISSDTGDALRVDDTEGIASVSVNSNGNVGIGVKASETDRLSVSGSVKLADNVTVSGVLKANKGMAVSAGVLDVQSGISIKGSAVVKDGVLEAKKGASVTGGALEAGSGLNVTGAATIETGLLTAKAGVIVTGEVLEAKKGLNVSGSLVAKNGAKITGSQLVANAGAIVNNSKLIATKGLNVSGDSLVATKGAVFSGELEAKDGASVSGAPLKTSEGLVVEGELLALGTVTLGSASVHKLSVTNSLSVQSLSLQSAEFTNIQADNAIIDNLSTSDSMTVGGTFCVENSVVLGGGNLCVTYEGNENDTPRVKVLGLKDPEVVSNGTGHFAFDVDGLQLLTITYDKDSDIENLIDDWQHFKADNENMCRGFQITREGTGPWKIQEMETEIISTENEFQEFRIAENGLRILYTGPESGTPSLEIEKKIDVNDLYYDFSINGLVLTVKMPASESCRKVDNLLESWSKWRRENEDEDVSLDFEIQQTGDGKWQIDDVLVPKKLTETDDVFRGFTAGKLCVTHLENINTSFAATVKMNAALPGSESPVVISASYDVLTVDLGTSDNSPKAIVDAWNDYKTSGKETYDFDIKGTDDTTPFNVIQEEEFIVKDDTCEKYFSNYSVTYVGPNTAGAKIRIEMGGEEFDVIPDSNTLLTIRYPEKADRRTVTNLMLAWASVTEKHGFEIHEGVNASSDEFQVTQQEDLYEIIDEISKFNTSSTSGVDGFGVYYTGPDAGQALLTIEAGLSGQTDFDVTVDEKTIDIRYPENKAGTVDGLLSYWQALSPEKKGNFEIEKHDISQALVYETTCDLDSNPDHNVFSKGMIRTNIVTLDGGLAFSGSNIIIGTLSASDSLAENSDSVLPTQKSVKTYVDGFIELLDTEKADKEATETALDSKADKVATETALNSKADSLAMTTALSGKAGLVALNDISIGTSEISGDLLSDTQGEGTYLSLTADSRGMLMVHVRKDPGESLATGLFAIHGTSMVSKISGDLVSDTQGGGTYNIYYDSGSLTVENTSTTDAIVVTLTYFGA